MLQATIPNNIPILSACLKEAGHEVKLFDATLYKTEEVSNDERRVQRFQVKPFTPGDLKETDIFDELSNLVDSFNPHLIGITLVDNTLEMGIDLLESLKTDIPVIAGGVSVILKPRKILKHEDIAMICFGEGEKTIVDVCDYLQGKKDISEIKNLAYKKGDEMIFNEKEEPVDLNTLPFEDFTVFEEERLQRPMSGQIHKTVSINLDRGCPYSCTFCCAPFIRKYYGKGYYRMKSIKRIAAELEYQVKKHNPKYIYFNSETFLSIPIGKLREFAKMYKKYQIPFWCQTHIQTLTDEKVKLLKEMGCDKLSIGIECGNEEYRKERIKKKFTNKQAIEGFKILKKYDIDVGVNNIIGLPNENRRMIFETIQLNRKLNKIMGRMSTNGFIFQPYKGTELRNYCEQKGYIDKSTETDTLIGDPVIYNPNLSDEELIGLLRTFTLHVMMNKVFYPFIRIAERSDLMLGLLGKIYWKFYD